MRPEDRSFLSFRRAGDTRALADAYDATADELLEVALRLAGEPADAEDLVQSTWLAAIERAAKWDERRPLRSWLVGILTNEARRQRSRRRRDAIQVTAERNRPTEPDRAAENAEVQSQLELALAKVPERFRPVVQLKIGQELTVDDIARRLARPTGTVRSQLYRGLEALRRALPAGIAGTALLGLRPTRGLQAIRAVVLDSAPTAFAASAAPWIGGFVVSKKLALSAAIVVVLAAVGGWWILEPLEAITLSPSAVAPVDAPVGQVELEAPDATEPEVLERVAADRMATTEEPSTAAPTADVGTLLVHTSERDGQPAENHVVVVTPWSKSQAQLRERSGVTDAEGRVRFEGLPAGPATVALLRGSEEQVVLEPSRTVDVFLRVQHGLDVVGRVVDELGRSIPDARIWLSKKWRSDAGYVVATSAADGSFRLDSVSQEQWIGARKPGRAPAAPRAPRGAAGDTATIELVLPGHGASITGNVRDAAGRPIADATVLVGPEFLENASLGADGSHQPPPAPARARTDEHGRFALEGLPLGTQPVQASRPGSAPARTEVSLTAGVAASVDLVLLDEARVQGSVHSANGPVAFARVTTQLEHRFASSRTIADANGSFELGGLPFGTTTLAVRAAGFEELTRELQLLSGETLAVTFELIESPRIHGRLFDERGDPLAGWIVIAFAAPGTERHRSAPSSSDGSFTIDVDDEEYTLHVKDLRGWRSYPRLALQAVAPGDETLELVVPDLETTTGKLVGQVTDDGGSPVGSALVELWHAERSTWSETQVDNRAGRFEIPGLPPGTLHVRVRSADHAWKSLPPVQIDVGATTDLGAIVLQTAGEIVVRVRCVDGGELPELAIEFARGGLNVGVPRREDDGRWRSTPLEPGEYDVTGIGAGIAMTTRPCRVEAGGVAELELVVERAPTIDIVFEEPSTGGVRGWFVARLEDEHGRPAWRHAVRRGQDGRYFVRASAPAGRYRLVGETAELVATREVEITADSNELVTAQLRPRTEHR